MSLQISGIATNITFMVILLIFNIRLLRLKAQPLQYAIITALCLAVFSLKENPLTLLLIMLIIATYFVFILKINYYKIIVYVYTTFITLVLCSSCIELFSVNMNIYSFSYMFFYLAVIIAALIYPRPISELALFKEHQKFFDLCLLLLLTASSLIIFTLISDLTITSLSIASILHIMTLTMLYLACVLNKFIFKYNSLQNELEMTKNLNIKMRSQKHDFNNHLQVISALIQSKKYSTCFDYIININKHGFSKDNVNTGMLAINALLGSKQELAKNESIDFKIDVIDTIPDCFNMQSWEIITILGNLIDNAIYAEKKSTKEQKLITFSLKKNGEYIDFSINNSGSYIDSGMLLKIFEPGFSLKSSKNQGMGLHIIKDCVERHDGFFRVESTVENGTTFLLSFPQDIPNAILQDIV